LYCCSRLNPVLVLKIFVAVQVTLAVDQMKSGDPKGAYVALHYWGAANEADQNLFSTVVTLPNCQADKFTQADINVGVRIAIRERAVGSRYYVFRQKAHGSIQSHVHRLPRLLAGKQLSGIRQV
jgi:hypothetical protein